MEAILPHPFSLVALEKVESTNLEARRLAAGGAADSTVVWALEQTAGRGRRGRTWVSERGNLYASFILRPVCPVARAAELTFAASLAVAETVAAVLPNHDVACKWPNDVLVGGRKVSGIMLESETGGDGGSLDYLVIGVGINVHHHPDDADVEFPATDINTEGATEVRVSGILEAFCQYLHHQRKLWERQGFAPIREAWIHRAHGVGEKIRVRLADETIEGSFAGLDEEGALILAGENGDVRRVLAGDVFPAV